MNFLSYLIPFAFLLGVVVVIHELGHYWVARLCGVKVLRFSVGFGRPIVKKRFGPDATEWALGAFPLGGYVKMLDEREGPVPSHELPRAFNRQSVGKRCAIVAAGPVANFLLAIAVYWALFVIGVPGAKPILGEAAKGSAAAVAGFKTGERIVKIEDTSVLTWQDVRWVLMERAVQRATVGVETQDAKGQLSLRRLNLGSLEANDLDGEFLAKLGMVQYRPPIAPIIGHIVTGSVADRAGIKSGDEIVAVEGKPIKAWSDFVAVVQNSPEKPLNVEVRRGKDDFDVVLTPKAQQENGARVGKIGAAPNIKDSELADLFIEVRYPLLTALWKAVGKTWDTSVFSLKMLGKMLLGDISWKNLSGPITIADYAGQTAKLGWVPYTTFIALISISLGVLNLLPVPLLDGGHLMYYIAEIIKGSPVSERIMETGQQIGLALLLGLMLFAFYNDINRLITG